MQVQSCTIFYLKVGDTPQFLLHFHYCRPTFTFTPTAVLLPRYILNRKRLLHTDEETVVWLPGVQVLAVGTVDTDSVSSFRGSRNADELAISGSLWLVSVGSESPTDESAAAFVIV